MRGFGLGNRTGNFQSADWEFPVRGLGWTRLFSARNRTGKSDWKFPVRGLGWTRLFLARNRTGKSDWKCPVRGLGWTRCRRRRTKLFQSADLKNPVHLRNGLVIDQSIPTCYLDFIGKTFIEEGWTGQLPVGLGIRTGIS